MHEGTKASKERSARGVRACAYAGMLACLPWVMAACAAIHAKSAPDTPALDIPSPPPRVIDTVDIDPAPLATLPGEPRRQLPSAPPRKPPAATPKPEVKDPARTEPPAPPPVESAKPAADPPKLPPTTLQTTSADAEEREDQQIRGLLGKASHDLKQVDYMRLNSDARAQYDTAKRFVTQAENALRAKNLVFARTVADKAAALAAQLAGK